jgi:transcriptional regulator with XRE-family HTH domain
MIRIQEARQKAGISAAEVANAIGRTPSWLYLVECGEAKLAPEHERVILKAIQRLARFADHMRAAREKLTADLKLPPIAPTRGRPYPGGVRAQ